MHQVLTFIRKHDESATSVTSVPYKRHILESIDLLKSYGPVYLTPEEYEIRFKQKLDLYYRFLSHSLLKLRRRDFWEYQRDGIQRIGYKLSVLRLIRTTITELIVNYPRILESIRTSVSKKALGKLKSFFQLGKKRM